ncbi:hypothetical protein JVT61DRAFT_11137 [Boletus reticuloceps]|uniref:Uncharacterized protein n=1 Tax=Boletus reticuloceps TaxID=495285 RepID=A0A8I3A533_9AGAM|nr:hypothetical protein JVT61DRAFT_11137 [Boletus reticuloceps]
MSVAAYRLETPRPRPPPPPLRHPSPRTSVHINAQSNQTLLYDLPSSPPTSPILPKHTPASPASPSFPGGRARGRRGGRTGPTPPARNRSSTPLGVSQSDLEKFTDCCRSWYSIISYFIFLRCLFTPFDRYFDQDEAAGRIMTQTLANVAPSQRALYSRLQASVRSAYHASVNARRHAEFQAHICATQPGGSLMPHTRANPSGPMARKERFERLIGAVGGHAITSAPQQLGGAGATEFNGKLTMPSFKEAAYVPSPSIWRCLYGLICSASLSHSGKDFMLEAIDVLKGVLAFERCLPRVQGQPWFPSAIVLPFDGNSISISTPSTSRAPKPSPISMATHSKRARAPSDPFLDMPALSHSLPSASSYSSGVTIPPPSIAENPEDGPPPHDPDVEEELQLAPLRSDVPSEEDDVYLRIWTTPSLPNPEYLSLLTVFPSFVTRGSPPRFPISSHPRVTDIEEGEGEGEEGKEIRYGTGSMWVSAKRRRDGYKGGWWTRFTLWWRRVFC